jgi:hypothetical protein
MAPYTPKSPTVAATQFNMFASNIRHEHLVTCTGGGSTWGTPNPLSELPKGFEPLGPTTLAIKCPVTHVLTEIHDKDWIVYTEHGNVLVIPNTLFNHLYQKL